MSDSKNQDTKPTTEEVANETVVDETTEAEMPTEAAEAAPEAELKSEPEGTTEAAVVAPEASEADADAAPKADAEAPAEVAPDAEATPPAADAAAKPKKRGRPRAKLDQLEVGSEHKGKVVGLAKFGAFVDIGAVTDGLVHVTELSQKRVRKVEDAVSMGDEVEVWIKDVDLSSGRVSLSMRRRPSRPLSELKSGDVLPGTVTSTTKYGVFVDIGSETEGLVHISEMSSGFVERPSDVASSGDPVEVRVKEIDANRERISLSMVGLSNDVGLEAAGEQMAAAEYASGDMASDEPEERMPTVVELALRRALGEMQDEADTEPDADPDADGVAEPVEEETPAVEATEVEAEAEVEAVSDNGADAAPTEEDDDSLGEMYERMIAAYKEEKSQQG